MPTPNAGIPWVPEGTLDPAAALNESLRVIDAIIQPLVIGMNVDNPPLSPEDGDRYIVGTGTGDWAGQDDNLAQWVEEGAFWQFYRAGEQVVIVAYEETIYTYSGSSGWMVGNGIPDAPIDGTTYGRRDGAWDAISSGSGDVVGPASSVNDRIALFDGTTGKLLKQAGKTVADLRAPSVQSIASAATVTPTFADDLVIVTALAANVTIANPTGTAADGQGFAIRIKDNGTARTIAYGTQYRAIGVTMPTTTILSKTLYLAGVWNAADTTFDVLAVAQQA